MLHCNQLWDAQGCQVLKGWGSRGEKSQGQPGRQAHNPVKACGAKGPGRMFSRRWGVARRKHQLFLQGSHLPCFVLLLKKKLRAQLNITGAVCVQRVLRKGHPPQAAGWAQKGRARESHLLAAGSVVPTSCYRHFFTLRTFAMESLHSMAQPAF